MSTEKVNRIHLIYGICMSVLSVVLATLCIILCLNIYNSGDDPFTRYSIGKSFSYISALVYVYIAVIIGGVALNVVAPREKKRLKGTVEDSDVLYKMSKHIDKLDNEAKAKIEKQRTIRFIMLVISGILVFGATVASLVHVPIAFNVENESTNNEVFLGWMLTLRYFIFPLAYLIFTTYICKRSVKREIQIIKDGLKAGKLTDKGEEEACEVGVFTKLSCELTESVKKAKEPKKWHKPLSLTIKCVIGCLAVVFIIVGIVNGGAEDVVNKACQICRECIGMG